MSAIPVRARGAGRRFGSHWALRALDLDLSPGRIAGLIGPNGSGKTTFLRLVAGLLRPSAGSTLVFGLDPGEARAAVMSRARFAFAPPALYESLSAREHLHHLSALGPGRAAAAEIDGALDTVGLAARADDPVREYSFGMRQRLVLAQALVPMPELLVLDEPNDGLDPLAVLELRRVLRRLRDANGVAILLASHHLVEVERLVDDLVVLHEGNVLYRGEPSAMRPAPVVRLIVDDPDRAVTLLNRRGIAAGRADGAVVIPDPSLELDDVRRFLADQGLGLREFHRERPSLEEALRERLRRAES